ncbi:hypothetical protein ACFLV4_05915 [Chloroflexota bacterium]
MIKLTKTSLLLLLAGVLVIALAGLGMAYSQQTRQQSSLDQELAQAQLILTKSSPDELSTQKDGLEKKLVEATSQLETLKSALSTTVESIESSDSLFNIAENCDVEIVAIKSSAPTNEKLNGAGYSTISLTVKLEGDVFNIMRFIYNWTEECPTGVVKSVRVNVPKVTGEEEEVAEGEGETGEEEEVETSEEEEEEVGEIEAETQKPSADITLIIYTYQRN